MPRTSNTTGPCAPALHAMRPPRERSRELLPPVQEQRRVGNHPARSRDERLWRQDLGAGGARLRLRGA